MSSSSPNRKKTNIWLVIAVIILVVLLFVWLTFADLSGDTDVAACALPSAAVPGIINALLL